MNKIQINRLKEVRDFLTTVPEDNFDLGKVVESTVKNPKEINTCNSTCCVIGWMPLVFPRNFQYSYTEYIGHSIEFKSEEEWDTVYLENRKLDIDVLQDFFGLSHVWLNYLFIPSKDCPIDHLSINIPHYFNKYVSVGDYVAALTNIIQAVETKIITGKEV